jgi:hypothetical protein
LQQKVAFRHAADELARSSSITGRPLTLFRIMRCATSNTEEASFTDRHFGSSHQPLSLLISGCPRLLRAI